jgi:methionyl aminopeptidase
MWRGIAQVKPGARLGDIGHAIERHAKKQLVIRSFGIIAAMVSGGKCMKNRRFSISANRARPALREGMVFTIEPMINQGTTGP